MNFIFTLPWSRYRSQRPMYKGLRAREGHSFSPPVSLPFLLLSTPPFFARTVSKGVKEVKGVKGVKDISHAMVFSAESQGFFKG